jgi:hypothetical protein
MSVDLPAAGSIRRFAPGEPYLAIKLALDPKILASLLAEIPKPAGGKPFDSGFSVAPVTPELLDAWHRMMRLLDHPDEIAVLAPVYEREVLFRGLQGPLGDAARYCHADQDGGMAEIAALSVSAFHTTSRRSRHLAPRSSRSASASCMPARC